jgi:hypothetical protein
MRESSGIDPNEIVNPEQAEKLFDKTLGELRAENLVPDTMMSRIWDFLGVDSIRFRKAYGFQSWRGGTYERSNPFPENSMDSPLAGYHRFDRITIYLGAAHRAYIPLLGGWVSAATHMRFTILHEFGHTLFGQSQTAADAYAAANTPH